MARLTIPDEQTYATFTATAQTVFPISFALLSGKPDLRVSVDGVKLSQSAFTFSGTLLDGGGYSGGTVTLNTAATGKVRIWRDVTPERSSQFAPSNSVPVGSIDGALNRGMALLQDLQRDVDRSIKAGVGEAAPTVEDVLTAAGAVGGAFGTVEIVPEGGSTAYPLATLLGLDGMPEKAGASPDQADSRLALTAAANSGVLIDGASRRFKVSGQFRPSSASFAGLKDLTVEQVSNAFGSGGTLLIDGLSDFVLDQVTIDEALKQRSGGFSQCYGIQISNCSNFRTRGLTVRNGSGVTGIAFIYCTDFVDESALVEDFEATFATQPTDDVIQGINYSNCRRFVSLYPTARRLSANWPGRPTPYLHWSRGIAVSACVEALFVGPHANNVEQGMDVSGGGTSNRILILHPMFEDCSTWGLKFAITNHSVRVVGGQAVRCGAAAITVTGNVDTVTPQVQRFRVNSFDAYDIGSNGLHGTVGAFTVVGRTGGPAGFPADVIFENCRAIDTQTVKTMDYGFWRYDESGPFTALSNVAVCETINCQSIGHVIAGSLGFSKHEVSTRRDTTLSIPNSAWTSASMDAEAFDSAAMHSTSSNPSFHIARVSGTYLCMGTGVFDQNATGRRGMGVLINGGSAFGRAERANEGASLPTPVAMTPVIVQMSAGDRAEPQYYQTSGSPLNITSGTFQMVLLSRDP